MQRRITDPGCHGSSIVHAYRLHVVPDQVATGSRTFFCILLHFSYMFTGSLHTQALAFSKVPIVGWHLIIIIQPYLYANALHTNNDNT